MTSLVLDDDEALVLFEMLSRWSEAPNSLRAIDHPAEDDVLSSLLAGLERQLTAPFQPDYQDRVSAARERLTPSGG